MKFSMTGQEKCDFLIEVTAWTGLTLWFKVVAIGVAVMVVW